MRNFKTPHKLVKRLLTLVLSVLTFSNVFTTNASAASNVIGVVDYITTSTNTVSVGGWRFSPSNKSTPLKIQIKFSNRTFTATADHTRQDVDAVYSCGIAHGFGKSITIEGLSGNTEVVVQAVGCDGSVVTLGRKTVNIPGKTDNHLPTGVVDSVENDGYGNILFRGWAQDASSYSTPIALHVYRNYNGKQVFMGAFSADKYRPDVNSVYKSGSYHGFSSTLKLPADAKGIVSLYVFAINVGGGSNNVLIGAKEVFAGSGNPAYDKNITKFINNPNWSNGASWDAQKRPISSTYGSSGCCRYTADYTNFMYSLDSPRSGTSFTNPSQIKSGDVIYVSNSSHWFVVLGRFGEKLITAEGNWGGKVVISASRYTVKGNTLYRNNKPFRTFQAGYHYI